MICFVCLFCKIEPSRKRTTLTRARKFLFACLRSRLINELSRLKLCVCVCE